MSAHVEATFTGTIRMMDELNTHNGQACINVYIPEDKGKDDNKHTCWHQITFWGPQAEFAAKNFYSGTVITVTCSINSRKGGKVTFNARIVTALANWGKPKQAA